MIYKTEEDLERVISLGKTESVLDIFIASYLEGVEYDAWLVTQKETWAGLYPQTVDGDPIYDTDGTTVLSYEQIPNPDYITFEAYLEETYPVQVGTKDVLDADGVTVIGTEPVYVDELVRPYDPPPVDVAAWKASSPLYNTYQKGQRDKLVKDMEVVVNTVAFDADENSMDRMNRVVSIANFKFNQAIAQGTAPALAYDAIYKTQVFWKGADNLPHTVQVESLAEALEVGLTDMATIWESAE